MDIRNILCSQTLGAFIAAVCLLLPVQVGASIKHHLSGNSTSSTYGSDSKGYFWSGHFSSNKLSHVYNRRSNKFIGSPKHQNNNTGWGKGWRSLSMALGKRGSHSGFSSTGGGSGGGNFNISHIKHPLVSELHYDGTTGLTFENWQKDPITDKWYDSGSWDYISSADTDARLNQRQIPEPTSLLLLSLGLYGIIATKKFVAKVERV